jgi:RNA-directed DNA polymerase
VILQQMAADLGLTPVFIAAFARGASHAYKSYPIRKRNGDTRTIDHPSKQLKSMQRWLLSYVIENLPVHAAATAYRKQRSIFDNARAHVKNKFLLRMDCRQFFPSITEADLMLYIQERSSFFSNWNAIDVEVFCKLVCRNSRLTIGAPTSPAISNAVCYDMDSAISALCSKWGVTYTRYADDLFFSTSQPDVLRPLQAEIEKLIPELKLPRALAINTDKTRHASKRGARRVTGIVLGSDGHPYIGRALKRRIRGMIHKIDELDPKTRGTLAGLVSYAVGFDPDFMNSLITKYGYYVVQKARFPNA